MEQELLTLPEHMSSPPVFSGVRFTRSLVLCVCFVDRCLSFCTFFFWPLCCLFFFDIWILLTPLIYKGNNKITEHRAIFKKEKAKLISQQTDKIWRNGKLGKLQWPWLGTGISKENNSKFAHFLFVHQLSIHFYSLHSSYCGFIDTLKPRNTVPHDAQKSNIIRGNTSKYEIDKIESQQISHLPPTHNELTPTKISETSVCQECKYM